MNGLRRPMCDSTKVLLQRLRQRLNRLGSSSYNGLLTSSATNNNINSQTPDYFINEDALKYSPENVIRLVFLK